MYRHARGGHYQPTRETYPLMQALAVAVAVDRTNGFIKSRQGYFDTERDQYLGDNRSVCMNTLRSMNGKPVSEKEQVIVPLDSDIEAAQEIFDYFDQTLLMQKLGDDFTNDYNKSLAQLFGKEEIDVNSELAKLASLPNSRRIAKLREEMDEFYEEHAKNPSGYVGDLKQRLKVTAFIKDVKFIPRDNIHLAVGVTADNQLVKFFMNDKMSDIARTVRGTTLTFVGTVKKQEVNSYTACQETMFNRIKIV